MRDATTAPVVGDMVSVPSEFETALTAPPLPDPHAEPVPERLPLVSTWRHEVVPVIFENLVVPETMRLVTTRLVLVAFVLDAFVKRPVVALRRARPVRF